MATRAVTFTGRDYEQFVEERILKACAKRPHALTLPGRFSWIIQCRLWGPSRGPVGSSVR